MMVQMKSWSLGNRRLPWGERYEHVVLRKSAYMSAPEVIALGLVEEDPQMGDEPLATITVNLKESHGEVPQEGAFFVKTWAENEGLLEWLIAEGIVERTARANIPVNQWGSMAVEARLTPAYA